MDNNKTQEPEQAKQLAEIEEGERAGDLLSVCCNAEFDPVGFPVEGKEGQYKEKCLKCGQPCEVTWVDEKKNDKATLVKTEEPKKDDGKNKGGRPKTSQEEKEEILQKLEPYLKSGLSVNKALREAEIPNSTFYRILSSDEGFREKIAQYRQYIAVLLNSSIITHLNKIVKKQSEEKDLSEEEIAFLWKFATNSSLTKEEFGERKDVNLYDPEAELQKLKSMLDEIPE